MLVKADYGKGLSADRLVAVQEGQFVAAGCALPVAGNEAGVCAGRDRRGQTVSTGFTFTASRR